MAEFTQQDGPEEQDSAMLVCEKTWQGFAWSSLTLTFFGLLQEYLFKGRWSLVNVYESFLKQNYCHANSLLLADTNLHANVECWK